MRKNIRYISQKNINDATEAEKSFLVDSAESGYKYILCAVVDSESGMDELEDVIHDIDGGLRKLAVLEEKNAVETRYMESFKKTRSKFLIGLSGWLDALKSL